MNLLDNRDDQSGDVYFVNFNQDCTSLAVGSNRGFKLYSFNQVNELEVIHENNSDDIRIVERLFSSSLVALVTISAPRKLKVCHFQRGSEICNYSYSNTILAVKLNRARLVVCLEESLYIHNIRDMKVLHTIRETPPNPNGLCVLSVNNDNCYLAYPGSSSIGEVQIFDALNLQAKSMIPAHDNPLAAMAFDPTGVKLATASGKGTVIRVFNVIDGTKLYEFRRGVKRCVTIFSLSFSEDSAFLSASSNTETVHIFRLEDTKDMNENKLCSAKNPGKPSEEPQSWFDYFSKTFMQSASYLPTQVADMFNQGRSFATAHLPFSGMKNICSLAIIQKRHRVVIAADNGMLYIHDLDKTEGGDCPLINTHQVNVFDEERGNPDEQVIPVAQAEQIANRRPGQPGGTTYAAVVRGNEAGSAQERKQEKISTDAPQNESAPGSANSSLRCEIKLDDESEFPPMAYKSEV